MRIIYCIGLVRLYKGGPPKVWSSFTGPSLEKGCRPDSIKNKNASKVNCLFVNCANAHLYLYSFINTNISAFTCVLGSSFPNAPFPVMEKILRFCLGHIYVSIKMETMLEIVIVD